MDIKIITPEYYKKTEWSGGTTTELLIHPDKSVFKSGNYDFRLSIASVEIEESTFTKLEDVNRTLLVLEGKITLDHENHHKKSLNKLEKDQFHGNWITKCTGTCTDFNLMTKGETSGIVTPIVKEGSCEIQLSSEHQFTLFYIHKGVLKACIEDQEYPLNLKDLLMIQTPPDTKISFSSDRVSEIIRVDIK